MTPTPDLQIELRGAVALVRLTRAAKRNALNDALILAIRDAFMGFPDSVGAAVIDGDGEHFCAGLDLSEIKERDAGQGMRHSRMWHAALQEVQYGRVPVIAGLHGAVVGGGLELAAACHIPRRGGPGAGPRRGLGGRPPSRTPVADDSAFYALPEGSRGIFVGGGGSVRIP